MRKLAAPRQRVIEVARKHPGIYRAKLAEPYDGVGQYVLVALASSSIAAAYKARVAAGDFGGGRTFPRGTPVTVVSNRGQLEVFLGNLSSDCKLKEDFKSEASQGWPDGPFGVWAVSDISSDIRDFSVDGTYGIWDGEGFGTNANVSTELPDEPILPIELLLEVTAKGDNPFVQWDPAFGNSKFALDLYLSEAYFVGPQAFLELFLTTSGGSGLFLRGTILDQRTGGGERDLDDDTLYLNWPPTQQDVGPLMIRFYIDEYGVYVRAWLKDTDEPLVQQDAADPTLIVGNVVHPFWFDPAKKAQFQSQGGGKGEPWSGMDVTMGMKDSASFINITTGGGGQHFHGYLDYICFKSGF